MKCSLKRVKGIVFPDGIFTEGGKALALIEQNRRNARKERDLNVFFRIKRSNLLTRKNGEIQSLEGLLLSIEYLANVVKWSGYIESYFEGGIRGGKY